MLHSKRHAPTMVEDDFEWPVAADCALRVLFAAAEARPVEVLVDGRRIASGCRSTTGGWLPSNAAWEETGKLDLGQGKHTLKLSSARGFPHIVTLRLEAAVAFPPDWKPAQQVTRLLPVAQTPPAAPYKPLVQPTALRLDRMEQDKPDAELIALHDEALLANPLLSFAELLLVKRRADSPSLGLPANYNCNVALPVKGFDDEIAVLSLRHSDRPLRTLFRPQPAGFVGDVDLHFDADRLLFFMRNAKQYWQVCEVRTDGTGFRMLTGEQPDVHRFDACYLPDGVDLLGQLLLPGHEVQQTVKVHLLNGLWRSSVNLPGHVVPFRVGIDAKLDRIKDFSRIEVCLIWHVCQDGGFHPRLTNPCHLSVP